jgi:HTH-type transcriptional regulator/antitoxin MqsA
MAEHICPLDGAAMLREERPLTLTYKDKNMTFDMPGWYCHECGEGIHSGEDMKLSDRILNRLKARSEGLLEQEEIRRIRKKLHLSQEAAGFLIGGGPRAFQKYESGDLLPSRAVCNLLTVLDRVPDALKIIQEKTEQKGLQPFLEEYHYHNHTKNASTASTPQLG